jgi:hypothetical protein
VTIKTIYGRQEGAEAGYNPHKPGRPAHAYHTFFISRLRLALDVVVATGKQFHSRAVSQTFWQWWEQLPAEQRPDRKSRSRAQTARPPAAASDRTSCRPLLAGDTAWAG